MTYEETRGHPPDFEVEYRFLTPEEGGRKSGLPVQGYRSDWAYEGQDIHVTGIYMIHPEFLDDKGSPLPMGERIPAEGMALMWILIPQVRDEIHRARVKQGVRGFFMEGSKRVAEATVTRIIGLETNPGKVIETEGDGE